MIAVIFEVWPASGRKEDYLDIAATLKPDLEKMDGFVSVERFQSLTDPGKVPSTYSLEYDESVNRLTSGLRLIWVIPALIIAALLAIAAFFVGIISWFAILFTGKQPRGMFDFMVKSLRYILQTSAYLYLLTDTYPKF